LRDILLVLQAALLQADGGALTFEMLNPLSRAVPEAKEAVDIRLYLQVQASTFTFSLYLQPLPSASQCHLRCLLFCCDDTS